jgi:hypothetical protein
MVRNVRSVNQAHMLVRRALSTVMNALKVHSVMVKVCGIVPPAPKDRSTTKLGRHSASHVLQVHITLLKGVRPV